MALLWFLNGPCIARVAKGSIRRDGLGGRALFHLPDVAGAIDIEDPVEVVHLVLEDTRQPAIGLQAKRPAMPVETLHGDRLEALDVAIVARDGEAGLIRHDGLWGIADDLRVDHGAELAWLGRALPVLPLLPLLDDDPPPAHAHPP